MRLLLKVICILFVSQAVLAQETFMESPDKYEGLHRVKCQGSYSSDSDGLYMVQNEGFGNPDLNGLFGWHIMYMGDGTYAVADESTDPQFIILDATQSVGILGRRWGRKLTYDRVNKSLEVIKYNNTWNPESVRTLSNCVESDEISIHNPNEW